MRPLILALLAACVLLVSAGCQSQEGRVSGYWNGTMEVVDPSMKNLAQSLMGISIDLYLNKDKTFELSQPSADFKGTWKVADHTVVLTIQSRDGRTLDQIEKRPAGASAQTVDVLRKPIILYMRGDNLVQEDKSRPTRTVFTQGPPPQNS